VRVLVLSDIHSNIRALDAVLADAGTVDAIWHLGDVVGYGPDPDAVVARLAALGAQGVRGNHDSAALGGREIELFNADARRAMEWTRTVVGPETKAWLAAQPLRRTEGDFTLVHGSPRDPTWEYVTAIPIARANLAILTTRHCLFGHTHLPIAFRADGNSVAQVTPAGRSAFTLDARSTMLNPGSVGQPRDGNRASAYAVLDTTKNELSWARVVYDIAGTQAAMRRARLPERLIDRLDYGL
jgi:predicted phosphodiesterase